MKKKIFMIILLIILIIPIRVEAKNNNTMIYISAIDSCAGSRDKAIFGDINDTTSTAWLIQKVLNYIKVLGPTIAVVLGSIDMVKAIIMSDAENMKKAQTKFIRRILAAVAIFFVPLATSILLGIFGFTTDNSSCALH